PGFRRGDVSVSARSLSKCHFPLTGRHSSLPACKRGNVRREVISSRADPARARLAFSSAQVLLTRMAFTQRGVAPAEAGAQWNFHKTWQVTLDPGFRRGDVSVSARSLSKCHPLNRAPFVFTCLK